jgi:hypothetical protein
MANFLRTAVNIQSTTAPRGRAQIPSRVCVEREKIYVRSGLRYAVLLLFFSYFFFHQSSIEIEQKRRAEGGKKSYEIEFQLNYRRDLAQSDRRWIDGKVEICVVRAALGSDRNKWGARATVDLTRSVCVIVGEALIKKKLFQFSLMLQRWELINARLGRPPRDGKTCARPTSARSLWRR